MEIGSINPSPVLDALHPAWIDAGNAAGGEDSATTLTPHAPGMRADHGVESAGVQSQVRPQVSAADAPRPTDTVLPSASNALSEFAVPAAQLVPSTLIGLQVEAASAWPLLRRAEVAVPDEPHGRDEHGEQPAEEWHAGESAAEPDEREEEQDGRRVDACGVVLDDAEDDWCGPLTRALGAALAVRIPPQALLAAAEQWRRGRCVVLACPQGADPAGPAWAFVLWPRLPLSSGRASQGRPAPLALIGRRVEARLQWSALPHGTQWCHVRVVKEHHPRSGRQLIALDAADPDASAASGRVPCQVQLGPVLARSLRWCEVCLRIHAVRRFWTALGAQWSVHVVVCSRPLAGLRQMQEETR